MSAVEIVLWIVALAALALAAWMTSRERRRPPMPPAVQRRLRSEIGRCHGWPEDTDCEERATWRFWRSTDGTCWSTPWRLCAACKDKAMADPGDSPGLKPYCSELRWIPPEME